MSRRPRTNVGNQRLICLHNDPLYVPESKRGLSHYETMKQKMKHPTEAAASLSPTFPRLISLNPSPIAVFSGEQHHCSGEVTSPLSLPL
ncbi:hypothetical protein HAX54_052881 [Datura stramonium]|uniref:Uncharacterized protein n=1 Tax=Datura stramonium TaxID=4076 RepID=A0ABS8SZJ3_DATST|nr:hypothetical protein [Datura stramonium]